MNFLSWVLSFFKKVPHNSFPTDNQGIIEGIRDTDWVSGSIPFEVRNASGDWRPYLPTDERQSNGRADTMGCVSFSLTNSIEIQIKKLSKQEFNFSDRFLAKMSGTTRRGNLLSVVADTVRKYGLVKQETWPEPENYTWETYYSDIPQEIIDKGKTEFPFQIAYEWIAADRQSLQRHLQHAPIQITIPGSNPIHAVTLVAIVGDTYFYCDSYYPFLKSMSTPPASAFKTVVFDNRIVMRQIAWNDKERGVYVAFDTQARQLQFKDALISLFPNYRLEEREWNLGKRPWG